MAVISFGDPGKMNNMLAYPSLIAKCSLKYRWSSWVVYDQNFRQEAADTGHKDGQKKAVASLPSVSLLPWLAQKFWLAQKIYVILEPAPMQGSQRGLEAGTHAG